MKSFQLFFVSLLLVAITVLARSQATQAQEVPACPVELACPEIILSPANLLGDIYLNEQVVAGGVNRITLQIPPNQAAQVVVRNIQSPGEVGFNELFIYQETSVSVNVGAGRSRQYTLTPRQQFIRGTLSHLCEPRNIREGEDVSCQLIIDGVDRGVFPVGQEAQFILDPGARVVRVQLVGGSAGLWEPNGIEQNANITAGRTSNLRTRFDKRARLIMTLNREGVVADFYVNDVLIASQVPSTELWVGANVAQNIVVRNVQPPTPGFRWGEGTNAITLGPNQERTITVRIPQDPLVSAQQTRALDTMQSGLDRAKGQWEIIANQVWRGLTAGQTVSCGIQPSLPNPIQVNQGILDDNPAYAEALNVLNAAINETRTAIQAWATECTFDRQYVDPALESQGSTATNNAEGLFNDAQNRINALRNPPQ